MLEYLGVVYRGGTHMIGVVDCVLEQMLPTFIMYCLCRWTSLPMTIPWSCHSRPWHSPRSVVVDWCYDSNRSVILKEWITAGSNLSSFLLVVWCLRSFRFHFLFVVMFWIPRPWSKYAYHLMFIRHPLFLYCRHLLRHFLTFSRFSCWWL